MNGHWAMSLGVEDDAISIVSDTTHNSDGVPTDIPIMLQHRQADPLTRIGYVFQTESMTTDCVGTQSPIIPYHDDKSLQVCIKELCPNVGVEKNHDDDDDCSEMSEVLIPLKQTSANTDTRVVQSSSSIPDNHSHRQQQGINVEQSQSLLQSSNFPERTENPDKVDDANNKDRSGASADHTGSTESIKGHTELKLNVIEIRPGEISQGSNRSLCTQDNQPQKPKDVPVHRTRSSTQTLPLGYEERKKNDMLKEPCRTLTQFVSDDADDACTDKLTMRIGKLLDTVNKTPPRQQEVIKTAVEHCMVKLQDTLERKLSNIQPGEFDQMNHGKLRKLILIIQSNLSRVMQFYKSLESQGALPDLTCLMGMHLQHKKNLLAIVQRHKLLVKQFKALDRTNLSKSDTSDSISGTQTSHFSQDITTSEMRRLRESKKVLLSKSPNQCFSQSLLLESQTDIPQSYGDIDKIGSTGGNMGDKQRGTIDVKQIKRTTKTTPVPSKRKKIDRFGYNQQEVTDTGEESNKSGSVVDLDEGKKYADDCIDKNKKEVKPLSESLWLHMLQDQQNSGLNDQIIMTDDVTENTGDEAITGLGPSNKEGIVKNLLHGGVSEEHLWSTTNVHHPGSDDTPHSQSYQDQYFSDDESVELLTATKITECIPKLDHCLSEDNVACGENQITNDNKSLANDKRLFNQVKEVNPDARIDSNVNQSCIKMLQEKPLGQILNNVETAPMDGRLRHTDDNVKLNTDPQSYPSQIPGRRNVRSEDNKCDSRIINLPGPTPTSPTSTCVSSDIFMVKTTELNRRLKQRNMEQQANSYLLLPKSNQQPLKEQATPKLFQGQTVLKIPGHQVPSVTCNTIQGQGCSDQGQRFQGYQPNVKGAKHKSQQLDVQGQRFQGYQRNVKGAKHKSQQLDVQGQRFQDQTMIEVRGGSTLPNIKSHGQMSSMTECIAKGKKMVIVNSGGLPSWREIITEKVVVPGKNVLSVNIKNIQHVASLTHNGKIQDSRGMMFNTPAKWLSSLHGGQTVKNVKAYQQVFYKGKTIKHFCMKISDNRPDELKADIARIPELFRNKSEKITQTESTAFLNSSVKSEDQHLNNLLSQSIIRLLNINDFVSCNDLPENFWSDDFSQVKLDKALWDTVTCW